MRADGQQPRGVQCAHGQRRAVAVHGLWRGKKYNAAAGKVLAVPALPVQGDIFIYREKENDTLLLRTADGEYREKYDADSDGLIFEKTSVLDCSGTTYAVNYQSDSGAELICGGRRRT